MDATLPDPHVLRQATNVTIRRDVLEAARKLGVNLSRTLETRLIEILALESRRQWTQENTSAIEGYNERIEARGTFSDGLRRF